MQRIFRRPALASNTERPSALAGGARCGHGAAFSRSAASAQVWPGATPQAAASALARLTMPRRIMSSASPMRALAESTAAIAMPSSWAKARPPTPASSRPMPASWWIAARAPALARRRRRRAAPCEPPTTTAPSASGGSLVTLGTTRMATVMATSYRQCAYKSAHARTGERTHGRQQGRGADPAASAGAGPRAGHGRPALPDAGPCQALGRPVVAQSRPCAGRTG